MKPLDPLAAAQINRRTKALREAMPHAGVSKGWISFMRHALNMTLKQLGERAGLGLPTVAQTERNEIAGKTSLATLRKMAHAMECELIYAFVPRAEIGDLMKDAARTKAKRILEQANTHMALEDQSVEQSLEQRVERLATKLLQKGDVW